MLWLWVLLLLRTVVVGVLSCLFDWIGVDCCLLYVSVIYHLSLLLFIVGVAAAVVACWFLVFDRLLLAACCAICFLLLFVVWC